MGGLGSGRSKYRQTVDGASYISAAWVKQWGWIDNCSGSAVVRIGHKQSPDMMQFTMQMCGNESERFLVLTGDTIHQIIHLEGVPLHFGERWYFLCPGRSDSSERRVARLYLPRGRREFACRQCHELNYVSQHSTMSGLLLRAAQIRSKLGGPTQPGLPLPDKPKGMHLRTYWAQCQKIMELETEAVRLFERERAAWQAWVGHTIDWVERHRSSSG